MAGPSVSMRPKSVRAVAAVAAAAVAAVATAGGAAVAVAAAAVGGAAVAVAVAAVGAAATVAIAAATAVASAASRSDQISAQRLVLTDSASVTASFDFSRTDDPGAPHPHHDVSFPHTERAVGALGPGLPQGFSTQGGSIP